MPVKFQLTDGETTFTNDAKLVDVKRVSGELAMLLPVDVVQGDFICYVKGHPRAEVVAPPEVL